MGRDERPKRNVYLPPLFRLRHDFAETPFAQVSMDLGLRKKVAVVTAASKGLGKATAFALAKEGARLVICSRTEEDIEATAKEIRKKTGATVVPVVADVANPNHLKRLVATAR